MRTRFLAILATLAAAAAPALAGLASQFAGYRSTSQIGVSGYQSSYHGDSAANRSVTGQTIANSLAVFGANRVSYPNGVGSVPSPGGAFGAQFDMGMLGIRVRGNQMSVRLASRIDPNTGVYSSSHKTWYGSGDVFLGIEDSAGVRQFALLQTWARDRAGQAVDYGKGFFDAAEAFHLNGREGHLVSLTRDRDVQTTGGPGGYSRNNAPAGLDVRAFAKGGTDLGFANLTHGQVQDLGQTWYLSTWTFDLSRITSDSAFGISLHSTASCGNDSIGMTLPVPAPAAAVLGTLGLALIARIRRVS